MIQVIWNKVKKKSICPKVLKTHRKLFWHATERIEDFWTIIGFKPMKIGMHRK